MYEVACHSVLWAHIKARFKTNTRNWTREERFLTEDSFTSTPPHPPAPPPPPADYLTSVRLPRWPRTWVRDSLHSSTQCNLRSASEWHNAKTYAKLSQTTRITLWLFTCEIPERIGCLLSERGHGDSGTDTPNHSDSFLVVFPSPTSCVSSSTEHYAYSWGLVIRLISHSDARRTMSLSGLLPAKFLHFFISGSHFPSSFPTYCVVCTSCWEAASSWKAAK